MTARLATAEDESQAAPDKLIGSWDARTRLEQHGVAPFAVLTSEVWGNAAGGVRPGAWYDQLLDFGVELDTEKLGWWKGGSFFAQVHWVQHAGNDTCFDEYTGAFNPVSGIFAGDQFRVYNLYYQHTFGDDKFVLKLGQIATDDDFMKSDYGCLFLNSAFGAMPSQVGTPLATSCDNSPAFPIYSVAAPGIFLRYSPITNVYTQIGLTYGRPGFDEKSNHGFGWVDQTPPEMGLFWESGYHYNLVKHPSTVRFGLSYHTGPRDNFAGDPENKGNPPQAVPNYYLIHDIQLLTDAEGHPKLGLFCRGGLTPEPDLSKVSYYADGGLSWMAPLPSRPDDAAGIGVSYTQFGNAYRVSTGSGGIANSETTLELTYSAKITPWMTLQADTQFLFNPAVNPSSNSRQTGVVFGLRAQIVF